MEFKYCLGGRCSFGIGYLRINSCSVDFCKLIPHDHIFVGGFLLHEDSKQITVFEFIVYSLFKSCRLLFNKFILNPVSQIINPIHRLIHDLKVVLLQFLLSNYLSVLLQIPWNSLFIITIPPKSFFWDFTHLTLRILEIDKSIKVEKTDRVAVEKLIAKKIRDEVIRINKSIVEEKTTRDKRVAEVTKDLDHDYS